MEKIFSRPPKEEKKKAKTVIRESLPGIINDRPFVWILAGAKGSGKSCLCVKLLKTHLCGVFEEIIIISPTFRLQYKKLWSQLSPDGITVHELLDDTLLDKLLTEQCVKHNINSLIIFDDNGSDIRKVDQQKLNKLISNSRHTLTSCMFLSQRVSQNMPIIRSQCDIWCVFAASSYMEREIMYKEVSVVDRKTFQQMFNSATTDKPHSFLVSVIDRGGKMRFYHSDFKTLVT
jgi:hypothetical protein